MHMCRGKWREKLHEDEIPGILVLEVCSLVEGDQLTSTLQLVRSKGRQLQEPDENTNEIREQQ